MVLNAKLEKRTSKKSGNDYYCIVVKIADDYEKIIFLDKAEVKLIELLNRK